MAVLACCAISGTEVNLDLCPSNTPWCPTGIILQEGVQQRKQDLVLMQQLVHTRLSPEVQRRALALHDQISQRLFLMDRASTGGATTDTAEVWLLLSWTLACCASAADGLAVCCKYCVYVWQGLGKGRIPIPVLRR